MATPFSTSMLTKYALALGLIILLGIAPILITVLAGVIANANACILNEGSINPCVIVGVDMGETLYVMGMMAWFAFYSVPIASLAFMVWFVVLFVHAMARIFRKDPPANA